MHIQNPTLPNHPTTTTTTTTLNTHLSPHQPITVLPTSSYSDHPTISNLNTTTLNTTTSQVDAAEANTNTNTDLFSVLSVLLVFLLLGTLIFSILFCHIRATSDARKCGSSSSCDSDSDRDSNGFRKKRKGYSRVTQSEDLELDQDGNALTGNNTMTRSHHRGITCPKSILRWRREGCIMGRRGVKGSVPACVKREENTNGNGELGQEIPVLVKRVSWPDGGEEGKRLEERFVDVYLLERDEMDGGDCDGSGGMEVEMEGRRGSGDSEETLVGFGELDLDVELI